MSRAGGYILPVPANRRETLLDYSHQNDSIGEPVEKFGHSAKAPLIVFVSFRPGEVTHIADGRKGVASGSGLVRLNLRNLQTLKFPVRFNKLESGVSRRATPHVRQRLREGGLLPPASFRSFVDTFARLSPETADRLERFAGDRMDRVSRLSDEARFALAQQKEGVGLALKIAGFDTRELLDWAPPVDGKALSFLDGLPEARLREDAMVIHDLDSLPGFEAIKSYQFAARVFENEETRLTIILANKLPLEEQFGTDLIYYNETLKSFVMVQYKAMERRGTAAPEYRLPDTQLDKEIARMHNTLKIMETLEEDNSRDGFRLNTNPFFMKLCSRHTFNPDDGGLFPGMYLPIDYWNRLVTDDATLGPRGGRLVTYDNVGRKISEADFVSLVSGAWLGTTPPQSAVLESLVQNILTSGKAVALAFEGAAEDDDDD